MAGRRVQEILGSMQKNLECSICLDLLNNPVTTRCDHHFCKYCMAEFLKQKVSVPCPICKKPVTKRSLSDCLQLQEIVTGIRNLVEAFQKDTGILFSPPRGPQSIEFFPCTPEQIQPSSLKITHKGVKRKSDESLEVPVVSRNMNIRNCKRRSLPSSLEGSISTSDSIQHGISRRKNHGIKTSLVNTGDSREAVNSVNTNSKLDSGEQAFDLVKYLTEGSCGAITEQSSSESSPQEQSSRKLSDSKASSAKKKHLKDNDKRTHIVSTSANQDELSTKWDSLKSPSDQKVEKRVRFSDIVLNMEAKTNLYIENEQSENSFIDRLLNDKPLSDSVDLETFKSDNTVPNSAIVRNNGKENRIPDKSSPSGVVSTSSDLCDSLLQTPDIFKSTDDEVNDPDELAELVKTNLSSQGSTDGSSICGMFTSSQSDDIRLFQYTPEENKKKTNKTKLSVYRKNKQNSAKNSQVSCKKPSESKETSSNGTKSLSILDNNQNDFHTFISCDENFPEESGSPLKQTVKVTYNKATLKSKMKNIKHWIENSETVSNNIIDNSDSKIDSHFTSDSIKSDIAFSNRPFIISRETESKVTGEPVTADQHEIDDPDSQALSELSCTNSRPARNIKHSHSCRSSSSSVSINKNLISKNSNTVKSVNEFTKPMNLTKKRIFKTKNDLSSERESHCEVVVEDDKLAETTDPFAFKSSQNTPQKVQKDAKQKTSKKNSVKNKKLNMLSIANKKKVESKGKGIENHEKSQEITVIPETIDDESQCVLPNISSPENHSVLSALYNRVHLGQNSSQATICDLKNQTKDNHNANTQLPSGVGNKQVKTKVSSGNKSTSLESKDKEMTKLIDKISEAEDFDLMFCTQDAHNYIQAEQNSESHISSVTSNHDTTGIEADISETTTVKSNISNSHKTDEVPSTQNTKQKDQTISNVTSSNKSIGCLSKQKRQLRNGSYRIDCVSSSTTSKDVSIKDDSSKNLSEAGDTNLHGISKQSSVQVEKVTSPSYDSDRPSIDTASLSRQYSNKISHQVNSQKSKHQLSDNSNGTDRIERPSSSASYKSDVIGTYNSSKQETVIQPRRSSRKTKRTAGKSGKVSKVNKNGVENTNNWIEQSVSVPGGVHRSKAEVLEMLQQLNMNVNDDIVEETQFSELSQVTVRENFEEPLSPCEETMNHRATQAIGEKQPAPSLNVEMVEETPGSHYPDEGKCSPTEDVIPETIESESDASTEDLLIHPNQDEFEPSHKMSILPETVELESNSSTDDLMISPKEDEFESSCEVTDYQAEELKKNGSRQKRKSKDISGSNSQTVCKNSANDHIGDSGVEENRNGLTVNKCVKNVVDHPIDKSLLASALSEIGGDSSHQTVMSIHENDISKTSFEKKLHEPNIQLSASKNLTVSGKFKSVKHHKTPDHNDKPSLISQTPSDISKTSSKKKLHEPNIQLSASKNLAVSGKFKSVTHHKTPDHNDKPSFISQTPSSILDNIENVSNSDTVSAEEPFRILSPENHSVLSALYNRVHLGQNGSQATICSQVSKENLGCKVISDSDVTCVQSSEVCTPFSTGNAVQKVLEYYPISEPCSQSLDSVNSSQQSVSLLENRQKAPLLNDCRDIHAENCLKVTGLEQNVTIPNSRTSGKTSVIHELSGEKQLVKIDEELSAHGEIPFSKEETSSITTSETLKSKPFKFKKKQNTSQSFAEQKACENHRRKSVAKNWKQNKQIEISPGNSRSSLLLEDECFSRVSDPVIRKPETCYVDLTLPDNSDLEIFSDLQSSGMHCTTKKRVIEDELKKHTNTPERDSSQIIPSNKTSSDISTPVLKVHRRSQLFSSIESLVSPIRTLTEISVPHDSMKDNSRGSQSQKSKHSSDIPCHSVSQSKTVNALKLSGNRISDRDCDTNLSQIERNEITGCPRAIRGSCKKKQTDNKESPYNSEKSFRFRQSAMVNSQKSASIVSSHNSSKNGPHSRQVTNGSGVIEQAGTDLRNSAEVHLSEDEDYYFNKIMNDSPGEVGCHDDFPSSPASEEHEIFEEDEDIPNSIIEASKGMVSSSGSECMEASFKKRKKRKSKKLSTDSESALHNEEISDDEEVNVMTVPTNSAKKNSAQHKSRLTPLNDKKKSFNGNGPHKKKEISDFKFEEICESKNSSQSSRILITSDSDQETSTQIKSKRRVNSIQSDSDDSDELLRSYINITVTKDNLSPALHENLTKGTFNGDKGQNGQSDKSRDDAVSGLAAVMCVSDSEDGSLLHVFEKGALEDIKAEKLSSNKKLSLGMPEDQAAVGNVKPSQNPVDRKTDSKNEVEKEAVLVESDLDDEDVGNVSSDANLTSSSAVSSQVENYDTQQRNELENDVIQMQQEIAMLEAALKNKQLDKRYQSPHLSQKASFENKTKEKQCQNSECHEYEKKENDDGVAMEKEKDLQFSTKSIERTSCTPKNDSSDDTDSGSESDDLFCSPLPQSPPSPPHMAAPSSLKLPESLKKMESILKEFKSPGTSKTSIQSLNSCEKPSLISERHVLSQIQNNETEQANMAFVSTGLGSDEIRRVQALASLNDSKFYPRFTPAVTHVIVQPDDSDVHMCERTLKIFQGIANKSWVVSYQWVVDSLSKGRKLPEETYEIQGDTVSNIKHKGPKRSRLRKKNLFEDYTFYIIGDNENLNRDNMKQLIELCGGVVLTSLETAGRSCLCVTCTDTEDDVPKKEAVVYKRIYNKYKIETVSREWVLDSITFYKIQNVKNYLLK